MTASALLILDIQNDFLPGGSLAVPQGEEIIPIINQYIDYFTKNNSVIFATKDWHPSNSKHFNKFGGEWPPHCVQRTYGAEFPAALSLPSSTIVLYKGMNENDAGYSVAEASDKNGINFFDLIEIKSIMELNVCGIAIEYCVLNSVIDILGHGLRVNLLADAIAGINLKFGVDDKAIKKMTNSGAKIRCFSDLMLS